MLALAALWGGQAAVSHSRPGHEDLTFWVHHGGLEQIDVEGELGFGDAARILMRRRANAEAIRKLRNRFVFTTREFDKLPADTARASFVIAQNRVFNLIDGKGMAHRVVETAPGMVKRMVAGNERTFDVRPLVKLKVNVSQPARIYLTGADGLGYAPKGTVSRFASEPAEQYFHARGPFEIELPAGETVIEAVRGPEYKLSRRVVDLRAPTEVKITLERWIDMAERRWYSSDAHIHANYTAEHHQVVTKDDVLTYTLAEDLHVPNMVVGNSTGAFLHDEGFFAGRLDPISRPPYLVWWNEEMRNGGAYGHMCLYGLKKLVHPAFTGFRDTRNADDYPPNYAQAKAAQEQGGAVTYAHPGYAPTFEGASMKEMPVDLALGQIDAMDVASNNPEEVAMEMWYRLLNCGFRVGISAGTDSFTNVADHYTPGGHRVYAHLAGPNRYEDWLAAYKRGRTFATNGPMIFLKVEGREPGDEVKLPAGPREVRVSLEVKSNIPVDKVELVVNGKPRPFTPVVRLDRSSWLAARVTGPWHRLVLNDGYAFAHTSPVYVFLGAEPIQSREDARFWTEWIDKLIQRTIERGRFSTPERREETVALFRKAREIYARQAR